MRDSIVHLEHFIRSALLIARCSADTPHHRWNHGKIVLVAIRRNGLTETVYQATCIAEELLSAFLPPVVVCDCALSPAHSLGNVQEVVWRVGGKDEDG